MNKATAAESSLLPQMVRWHVVQLATLLLIISVTGIGYSIWSSSWLTAETNRANNFHLSAHSHLMRATNKLRHIQNQINISLVNPHIKQDLQQKLVGMDRYYDSLNAYHTVLQEISRVLKLHESFPDNQFDELLSEITRYYTLYENYSHDVILKEEPTKQGIDALNGMILPVEQLARLHMTTRDDLLLKLKDYKRRQLVVLILLMVILLLAGLYIAWRSLSVITGIVSEIELKEIALRRSQKMDAIGQLAGGIAHDFNNLLGGILGNIELIELQTTVDDKTRKRFDTIKRSIDRAADQTKQLLGFSRTEMTAPVPANINQLIENSESLVRHSLTPQVEIVQHLATDLWTTEIDPGEFTDTYLNLVLNARDAMHGRGQLTIETKNINLDDNYCAQNPDVIAGAYVQLSISDDGEGIPPESLENIFDPFFTTKEMGKGTGLGLAMVFGFVKRSKGHIKVYSEPAIGTTFHLYLPSSDAQAQDAYLKDQINPVPRGSETILVVDDEEDLLDMVSEFLTSQGYQVITAMNAAEALQKLTEEQHIHLLFSDVVMPGNMNGYELAERAAKMRPGIKVLLTSGFTSTAVARNGQARFNANLLSKPYTLLKLSQWVRASLDI